MNPSKQRTINLTRVSEDNVIEEVLKLEFTYDKNIEQRCDQKREYFKQRQIAEDIYQNKFIDLNQPILDGIHTFIDKCLNVGSTHIFGHNQAENIFGAVLNLDMQISDHEPTFDLVAGHVKKIKKLSVIRIKANTLRKKNLLELLEPAKGSKHVFIMIEQAELLSQALTDMLVGHIRNCVLDDSSPTQTVIMLFCLSIHIQELPFDHVNCFGRMPQFRKSREAEQQVIYEELLRGRNVQMKLAHNTFNYIYEYFVHLDASLSVIMYLYQLALFEHYNHLEKENNLGAKRAISSSKSTGDIADRHEHVCDHIYCYTKLLREHGMWPEDVGDVYKELMLHENLAQSIAFVDAVRNLVKIPHKALLRRIGSVLDYASGLPGIKNGKRDLLSVFVEYQQKLINNTDSRQVLTEFMNELLRRADRLENPMLEDRGRMYFRDLNTLLEASLTSFRGPSNIVKSFTSSSTYFGILFDKILKSIGQMGVNDLYGEVMDDYVELIRSERSQSNSGAKVKSTPKKRARTQAATAKSTNEAAKLSHKKLTKEEEEGLAKAIFVDVIDSMELQNIVKLDPKRKFIKRLVWPLLD